MFLLKKYNFIKICNVEFRKDGDSIKKFYPQKRYTNIKNRPLDKNGKGAFCEFSINRQYKDRGVYFFKIDEEIKYIGRCDNLHKRVYGYGHIQPRNCYIGGQSTNCRINKLFLKTAESNQKIELYFLKTSDKDTIEKELTNRYNPKWNIRLKTKNIVSSGVD